VQHQGLLAAGRGVGGRRLPLDKLGDLGRRRSWSSPGGLDARSIRRWCWSSSWRRGSARRITPVGTFRCGSSRRGSFLLFKDGRNQRFRPPGSFFLGADVAGAGILGLWRGDKVLLRAVFWRCRGRTPRTCSAPQRGGRDVAGTRRCRA
jgi:hypothetical protein